MRAVWVCLPLHLTTPPTRSADPKAPHRNHQRSFGFFLEMQKANIMFWGKSQIDPLQMPVPSLSVLLSPNVCLSAYVAVISTGSPSQRGGWVYSGARETYLAALWVSSSGKSGHSNCSKQWYSLMVSKSAAKWRGRSQTSEWEVTAVFSGQFAGVSDIP